MNFKQFQFLKEKTIGKLREKNVHALENLERYDALTLAYMGDSFYSTYVRGYVLQTGVTKVRVLHHIVSEIICAKGQAKSFVAIEPLLANVEAEVAKRGRNSNVNVPKSAEIWEYRYSTAFEAVIGYLYLSNDFERLEQLCSLAIEAVLEDMK